MLIDDIRKKELGIFEIFAMARGIFRANLNSIIKVCVFIGIPINILLSFVVILATNIGKSINFDVITSDPSKMEQFILSPQGRKMVVYYIIVFMIQSMMIPLITMAVARITKNYATEKAAKSSEAMLEAFSKGYVLIGAALISEMVIWGGMIFIIPGLIFMVNLYFYVYAIVLDDKGIFESLSYSTSLVRGYFLKTAIAVVIIYCLDFSISFLVINLFPGEEVTMITELMLRFITNIIDCYFVVAITIFYINRQAVKEGITGKIEDFM
ncbi:MAG TPA: hypothetical protein DIC60_09285 [Lachnospiraceae bacterium]|nr:hypothetical protein [Lachnospiraceae bacterium]